MNTPPSCCLCGLPKKLRKLVRLGWTCETVNRLRLVVAGKASPHDVLMCEVCIRQVKRLPLTDLAKSAPIYEPDDLPF
jgi:hypothetical protein